MAEKKNNKEYIVEITSSKGTKKKKTKSFEEAVESGLDSLFGIQENERMAKRKSIRVAGGIADYKLTEIEDSAGRWNDNYYVRDGFLGHP